MLLAVFFSPTTAQAGFYLPLAMERCATLSIQCVAPITS